MDNNQVLDANQPRSVLTEAVEAVLKATTWRKFTEPEIEQCRELIRATGLNPIKKEIWFTKRFNKKTGEWTVQGMTGINGYYAIANNHPMFDGFESDVVLDEKGKPIYAWAKVYRKDREHAHPAKSFLSEYYDDSNFVWKTKPVTMIIKVAESIALRKAFPQQLNGTYTEEEMPREFAQANDEESNGKVIEKVTASAQPGDVIMASNGHAVVTSSAPIGAPIDWSSFKFVYRIKGNRDYLKDCAQKLRAYDSKFRGKKNKDGTENPDGDNLWYSNEFVEELSKFVEDNPLHIAKMTDSEHLDRVFKGDDVPY